MSNALGLLVAGLFAATGVTGLVRPELYRGSLEDQYTARRARITAGIVLLLGLCGLWAILHSAGVETEFFPV